MTGGNGRTSHATLGGLLKLLDSRGGHARLAELNSLNPRAEDILKRNGFNATNHNGRRLIGKSAPVKSNPLYVAAWLTEAETELLVALDLLGDMTTPELRAAFAKSRRPFPGDVIQKLVEFEYLKPARRREGALAIGPRGGIAITAMNRSAYERAAKAFRKSHGPVSSNLLELIEEKLTACMGSLRPHPGGAFEAAAVLDAAVVSEVVAAGDMLRNGAFLKRNGISVGDLDASAKRLAACGVVSDRSGSDYIAVSFMPLRDLVSDVGPGEAAAWFAARSLDSSTIQELSILWATVGDFEEGAVNPFLAEMAARGHVAPLWPDRYRMTDTGRAYVDHFGKLVDGLNRGHPLRIARANVDAACREWKKRTYRDGSRPRFLDMFPATPDVSDVACPPMPGDLRMFSITRPLHGTRTERDGQAAGAFEALACGPLDSASLAGCMGIREEHACRLLVRLAVKGLVKDVSPGAAERAASWREFCEAVAEAAAAGETSLPGADPDEVACAAAFLRERGDERVAADFGPAFPAEPKGVLAVGPSLRREPDRLSTKGMVLAAIRRHPEPIAELVKLVDVSRSRVWQITERLREDGLIRALGQNPTIFASAQYSPARTSDGHHGRDAGSLEEGAELCEPTCSIGFRT